MAEHLKYRYLRILRDPSGIFWALFFPMILATLFYFAFGSLGTASRELIPAALVTEEENEGFTAMLGGIDGELIELTCMSADEAASALADGRICGIYTVKKEPSLTVGANGISETILSSVLDSYLKYTAALNDVGSTHPENLKAAMTAMQEDRSYTREVSLGGRTYDNMLNYFFALIAMACFFGNLMGMNLAGDTAANISPLAARRCISPMRRLPAVLTDLLAAFSIQFANMCILLAYMRLVLGIGFSGRIGGMLLICALGSMLGVSFGILVGCLSRVREGIKTLLTVVVPLVLCFFSGLMVGNMKAVIEDHAPLLNRINPAALISDALYCLNVFDDAGEYRLRLLLLAAWSMIMTFAAFLLMRRDRYDSI